MAAHNSFKLWSICPREACEISKIGTAQKLREGGGVARFHSSGSITVRPMKIMNNADPPVVMDSLFSGARYFDATWQSECPCLDRWRLPIGTMQS